MKLVPSRPVRRLLAGLTPIALVCAALPLLAPTCGTFTPGVKSFSRNSLIIPMDVCYQCSTDDESSTTPSSCGVSGYVTPTGPSYQGGIACPGATDAGDVIKAYGLVYQLIRNGVAVYWIIEPSKAKLDAEDFHVSYSGPPAFFYNWTDGSVSATAVPATSASGTSTVSYRGGPFVIDGTDYAKASLILQQYKGTFGAVNLHVSNVAFQAPVARAMAGGWSAGGAIPPKLALLDIGSMIGTGTARNSEPVIRNYLAKAGLDTTGAGGTSATGAHGQIYDRLYLADFLPSTAGDWKTTKLYENGYQILWVPHWAAPGSCSDYSSNTNCTNSQYSDADVSSTVQTIGSFVTDTTLVGGVPAGKKDLFAECAGLGSFEGVPGNTSYSPTWFLPAQDSTHFHTEVTPGFAIQTDTPSGATFWGSFGNPLMQIGDYPFKPYSGAVSTYQATDYKPAVVRLISETADTTRDVFSFIPAESSHGTVVYLGGHSYTTEQGTFQTAAVRLILNTLFNLGASCVASGVSCSTGELGVCALGTMTCSGGMPVCTRVNAPSTETCNGLDDDCNGLVDDLPVQSCYGAPVTTLTVGDPLAPTTGALPVSAHATCRSGVRSCVELSPGTYGFGACTGEVLPLAAELCNGLDDDCNGFADDSPTASPVGSANLSQVCYYGPAESLDPTSGLPMGECRTGTQTCSGGVWSACVGQVTPAPECCGTWDGATRTCSGDLNAAGNTLDENCNGLTDETCGCTSGTSQYCYSGTAGTAGTGPCIGGTQTCTGSTWGACTGQVVPVAEICGNGIDDDCNGITDDPLLCNVCPTPPQECYEGLAGTLGVGVCSAGERTCVQGVFGTCGGVVGTTVFKPQILPSQEICDGLDNDCDGHIDNDLNDNGVVDTGETPPPCESQLGVPYQCVNGFCVPSYCNPAEPAVIEGYTCSSTTDSYTVADCGTTGAPCAPGMQCLGGSCIDPCDSITCGTGSVCGGGQCTGGSCYSAGCDTGQICKNGSCVVDPCLGEICPSGTFCREGDCVQACVYVSCGAGQRCGSDGFCETDPCADVTCTAGKVCAAGACITDPCLGISCGTGQNCADGICVDDPCAWIDCPVGVCYRGQCYSSANPTGEGSVPPEEEKPAGCGCASGTPSPIALLLGLFALPLARRRRAPRGGAGFLALALAAGLTATLAGCPKEEEKVAGPIDLMTDPANCGQLGNACDSGEICVDGVCGPGSAVAPFVTSVSPSQAPKGGTTVSVTLTGERFKGPAELRVVSLFSTTTIPGLTPSADGKTLTATIDISSAPTGALYLRVINADNVRSNSKPFEIILETPIVTAISPLTAMAGEVKTLHVTGTGLNSTSVCRISSTTYPDTSLATVVASGGLDCTLDTSSIPPGTYQIWVRNEGNLDSAKFTLVVSSNTSMSLASISPSSGSPGSIISLTAFGSGFDQYCAVQFDGVSQVTQMLDPSALFVGQLDLSIRAAGTWNVTVKCGSGASAITSNALSFTITASAPSLTLVSPQSAYQGETKSVTFTGANLPSGAGLTAQIRKLDGTWVDFGTTTWISDTSVTGSLSLAPATSWPIGEYQVRLKFPDGSLSSTFPFRVLSNAATLYSVVPAGGAQGVSIPSMAVAGSNFFTGIAFHLRTSSGADVATVPVLGSPAMTSTTASIGPLSLAGYETGLYQLVAVNTGSSASNALSFSVTPGLPTITPPLSPAAATQSDTPVTVTITGTNFAKPDASGSGGSQVVGWNDGLGIPSTSPIVIPSTAVQVMSATQIVVTLDTRNLIPSATAYKVQVWNPGGPTPPQKSGTADFTLNP